MLKKILHTDFYAWSYELLQILCVLPTAAVVFALLFMDVKMATWYIMYSLLGDACLILGIYFSLRAKKRGGKLTPYNIAFLALIFWALLSCFFAADKYTAFYSTASRAEGFTGILIYAGIYICGMQIKNEERRWKLLRLFMSGSALVCFLYLLQKSESVREAFGLTNNLYLLSAPHDCAVFAHFNHYGYYLTMVIVCAAGLFISSQQWKDRFYALLIFLINMAALMANDTFGCYLAVFAGLVLITICLSIRNKGINHRTFLPVFLFILISGLWNRAAGNVAVNFASFFHDTNVIMNQASAAAEIGSVGTGRGALWRQTLTYIKSSPIIGCGPDGLGSLYAADGFGQDRPANEYLQYAAYYGIPGLVLYLAALILLFKNKIGKFMSFSNNTIIIGCVISAYLISAFFGNTAFYTTSFFFLFLGMIAGENSKAFGLQ